MQGGAASRREPKGRRLNIPFETIIALILLELYRVEPSLRGGDAPTAANAVFGLVLFLAITLGYSWFVMQRTREEIRSGVRPSASISESYRLRVVRQKVLMVTLYGVLLHVFDWPGFITGTLGVPSYILVDDLLAAAPYLAAVAISWVPMHIVDRMLSRRSWGLAEYARFQVRYSQAMILLPWLAFKAIDDATILLPPRIRDLLNKSDLFAYAMIVVTLLSAVVLFPSVLKWLMRCESMPPGEMRERLESLCKSAKVKVRDILVWRMGSSGIMNAAVVGLFPRYRYILFSESLLDSLSPDECQAVLAHEMGHVVHRHTFFNLVFTTAFMLVMWNIIGMFPADLANQPLFTAPIMVAMLALYWRFVFGSISRRFERQADVAAATMMESPIPIIMALEKISLFSGDTRKMKNLRHGTVADRVRFLFRSGFDRKMIGEFNGEMRTLTWGMTVAAGLILAQSIYSDMSAPAGLYKDERDAQRLASMRQDSAEAWLSLGQVRVKLGKIEEAAGNFAKSVELDPFGDKAKEELRSLKKKGLEEWRVELHLGRAYYNVGWWGPSGESYMKAIELNPDSAAALAGLARLRLSPTAGNLYNTKAAIALAARAVELSPTAGHLSVLAAAQFAGGKVDEAIDSCRRARDLDPENHAIQSQLDEYIKARSPEGGFL